MKVFLQTLLIACIPAIITGLGTYFVALRNSKSQIREIKEQNKSDLDKLMKQHEIDIEALKQKHEQEKEILEINHKHQLELLTAQSDNDFTQSLLGAFTEEMIKTPEVKEQIIQGMKRNKNHKKKGKR